MAKIHNVVFEIAASLKGSFNAAFGGANQQIQKLSNQVNELSSNQRLINSFQKTQNSVQQTSTKLAHAQSEVKRLQAEIKQTTNPSQQLINKFNQAQASAGRLNQQLDNQRKALGQNRSAMQQAGISTQNLKKQHADLAKQITSSQQAQIKFNQALSKSSELKGKFLTQAATTVAAALPLKSFIDQAISFENSTIGIAKQLPGARDEMGKLTPKYYELIKSNQQLARTSMISTEGLNQITEQGLRMNVAEKDINSYTATVMKASGALQIDPESTAKGLATIQDMFHKPISEIGHLGDVINYLDDQTKATAGGIIGFMTRVGGTAAALHVTQEYTAAIGAAMMDMGETEENAATGVNKFFNALATGGKSKPVIDAFEAMGLSLTAVQKQLISGDTGGAISKISTALKKLPETKQLEVITGFVGLDHAPKMVKLLLNDQKLKGTVELATSKQANGSLEREYQNQLTTTSTQMQIFKNRSSELAVSLGATLLPPLNNIMSLLGGWASSIADLSTKHPVLVDGVTSLAGAFVGFKVVQLGVTGAQLAMNLAMTANPMGLILKGLIALGTGMWWFTTQTEAGRAMVAWFGEQIFNVVNAATPAFNALWSGIGSGIEMVKGWFTSLVDWIMSKVDAVIGIVNKVKSVFSSSDSLQPAVAGASVGANPASTSAIRGSEFKGYNPESTTKLAQIANSRTSNQQTINYSPTINVTGGADKNMVQQANKTAQADFDKQIKQHQSQKSRVAY